MFISQSGILVAVSRAPENAGLRLSTILSKWIEDGNNIDNYIVTYSPLMIERILTPWSVRIIVPKKVVELDANEIYTETMNDVNSLDHALKKGSIGALWKLSGVGLILAITTVLIMMLIRTVENREESLRKNQEEFRAIAENTTDYIMRYDRAGRHLYGNPMALNVTGVTADEYIGKTHKELGFPEHLCELWATAVQQVIITGKHRDVSSEVELQKGTVYLELSLDPEFDVDGNVASVLGISRDITYIKQAQEEKSNLEKRLQQAQKMEAIGTLAGGIAHDFNNILGAILGYTEMARDDCQPGSTVAKDLDKVLEASNRAKALIQQILAFSRQADTECISFQPASIISEALNLILT